MGRDPRNPHRSLADRKPLYEAVMRHKADGMSYNQIIKAVEDEFQVRLSKSHVSNWVRGDHVPDGSVTKFVPEPTAALNYVTGVMLGDGSTCVTGDHGYRLKLKVTDRDFAEAFAAAIGLVLKRSASRKILREEKLLECRGLQSSLAAVLATTGFGAEANYYSL